MDEKLMDFCETMFLACVIFVIFLGASSALGRLLRDSGRPQDCQHDEDSPLCDCRPKVK
jgi:hypothetical protein